jgi:hypothetical protein
MIVMGVNSGGNIYYANKDIGKSPNWTQIPGGLTNLSYSNKQVYGVNGGGNIYYNPDYTSGNWVQVPGGLSQVSFDGTDGKAPGTVPTAAPSATYDECVAAVENTGFIPKVTWGSTPENKRDGTCDQKLCDYWPKKYPNGVPDKYNPSIANCPKPAIQPPATQPAATQPTATQPAATQPAATQPTATQPAATQPAATQPTATQPVSIQPAATQPVDTQPAANQPAPASDSSSSIIIFGGIVFIIFIGVMIFIMTRKKNNNADISTDE